jgi:uncharacterized integral membrane protein
MEPTRVVKPAALLLAVAVLVGVIVQNRAPVQAHFLLITIEMPLILLLALTAGLGATIGLLAPALLRRSRRTWPRPGAASDFMDDQGDGPAGRPRAAT